MRAVNVDQIVRVVLEGLQAALRVTQDAGHGGVCPNLARHLLDPPIALTDRPPVDVHDGKFLGLKGADEMLGQCSRHSADLYHAPALLGRDVCVQRHPPLRVQPSLLHGIRRQLWREFRKQRAQVVPPKVFARACLFGYHPTGRWLALSKVALGYAPVAKRVVLCCFRLLLFGRGQCQYGRRAKN